MAEESSRAWKDQYMLRFPDGLRDRVKAAAEANNRSMNAEIVATLEEKYPAPMETVPMSEMMTYVASASTIEGKLLRAAEVNERLKGAETEQFRMEVVVLDAGDVAFRLIDKNFTRSPPPSA